ncbi:MAG: hypothetical protein ACPH9N_02850 [Alteromonas sp.]|jgi:hypothetical protein
MYPENLTSVPAILAAFAVPDIPAQVSAAIDAVFLIATFIMVSTLCVELGESDATYSLMRVYGV